MSDTASPTESSTASPTVPDLADAFGLTQLDDASLTRFARVHRGRTATGQEVVVKVAGSQEGRVRAMARWTRELLSRGVPVVTPQELAAANPQQVGGTWWVVYPFQEGQAYTGTPGQVDTAGELLGLIHAADVSTEGMRDYAWPDTAHEDVANDLVTLEGVLTAAGDPEAFAEVSALATRWWESRETLQARAGDLPQTGNSDDYKANNLVWTGPAPVLVDPDNGGVGPRLFELAYVATLFHNECDGAPGRVLSGQEWERFLAAYSRHVRLTDAERELWPLVLDHILWEEGTWALEDTDEQAWADPRQRAFLLDLARVSAERFPLLPS